MYIFILNCLNFIFCFKIYFQLALLFLRLLQSNSRSCTTMAGRPPSRCRPGRIGQLRLKAGTRRPFPRPLGWRPDITACSSTTTVTPDTNRREMQSTPETQRMNDKGRRLLLHMLLQYYWYLYRCKDNLFLLIGSFSL